MQDQKLQPTSKVSKKGNKATKELPPIPDKLYFSIGDVSRLCDLKAHVLRYWEQMFPMLKPIKRRGNRRYYQRKDVVLIRQIKHLLYERGFTIEGARGKLTADSRATANQPETAKRNSEEFLKQIVSTLETAVEELG